MLHTILIIICSLIIMAGVVGIIVPFLPGTLLVFLGVLIYALATQFATVSVTTIIILAILTVLAQTFDYLSQGLVAKKFGATRYGFWGGLVGLALGIIFSPIGLVSMIVLPFLGTIIGELITGRKLLQSGKVALSSIIGFFLSLLFNITISAVIIYFFLVAVI